MGSGEGPGLEARDNRMQAAATVRHLAGGRGQDLLQSSWGQQRTCPVGEEEGRLEQSLKS